MYLLGERLVFVFVKNNTHQDFFSFIYYVCDFRQRLHHSEECR